jgi:hypothetical protein
VNDEILWRKGNRCYMHYTSLPLFKQCYIALFTLFQHRRSSRQNLGWAVYGERHHAGWQEQTGRRVRYVFYCSATCCSALCFK